MNFLKFLDLIGTAFSILFFMGLGVAPITAGVLFIIDSQSEEFTKHYHETMNMGMGIISIVVGIPIAWVCLVRIVYLYRSYENPNA